MTGWSKLAASRNLNRYFVNTDRQFKEMAFNLQLGMTVVERTEGDSADEYAQLLGPEVANGKGPLGQKIVAGEYSLNALVAKVESEFKPIQSLYLIRYHDADRACSGQIQSR